MAKRTRRRRKENQWEVVGILQELEWGWSGMQMTKYIRL